ncbi:MAG: glycoside hydrolase family 127 protein [Planctomycetota bacterium]|nr:glycoside hydrolase family 127 protein [Planctomycetota bacterium]
MITPTFDRNSTTGLNLKSLGDYLEGVTHQWLLVAPHANSGMLEMFRDRDRLPIRNLVPWAGEFAGKYLTAAVQVLRLNQDSCLREHLDKFVKDLCSLQADDGYLGPFPAEHRLTGWAPNCGENGGGTWDSWGHYHVMLGLLLYHDDTGDKRALRCVKRIGNLFCDMFLEGDRRLVDTGSTEMNLAPAHSLCLLYRKTKDQKYLDLALKIVDEFSAKDSDGAPLAGDYLQTALNGDEFFETPKPRWESLHPIMALAELYWITGEARYREAFEHTWWSIVRLDRHNNGGFSSGEKAQGNPYHQGAIETCCTIAWAAMSVEMLRLSGSSIVADELEISTLNSVVGLHSSSGRWVTYNTPMDGLRKASAHEIVFQAREGTPELNCCSVNGPRGLGLISDWALMNDGEGIVVNWYGRSTMKTRLESGTPVRIEQETSYPRKGKICLTVRPAKPAEFTLKLRIPYWSAATKARLNGKKVPVNSGSYLALTRKWKAGDQVKLSLDMSPHFWVGEQESEGLVSMFRGPLLMTYDRRFNTMDPADVPALDARKLKGKVAKPDDVFPPRLLVEYQSATGEKLRLCDFGSAGEGGSPYRSWLKIEGVDKTGFSRTNPLRSGRP